MLAIAMPTYRRGTPEEGRKVWGDLRVCLHAVEAYALDYVDEIVVAWDGPWEPDGMPTNPKFRYLERPANLDMADAWIWAMEQTDADEFLQIADDVVLQPDTVRMIYEDIETIKVEEPQARIGMIGTRSNFVAGAQNVRVNNGGSMSGLTFDTERQILRTELIFTVCAWYTRAAWEHVGRFPKGCIWGGDILFSYDLKRLGYSHYVSRAYVHHVGWRGSMAAGGEANEMNEAGNRWLLENRPDFYEYAASKGWLVGALESKVS